MSEEEYVSRMTLEEKAGLLSGRDTFSTKAIERLGIPSVQCSDGPSGLRRQTGAADHLGLNKSLPATCFPSAASIAASWDEELAEKVGKAMGEEAVSQDVQVLLGPGLNIKRSPLCGRNFEYFSEDPYLSGKLAAGYVRGIQENGISACPKHFAVNSQELRRMATDSVVDERTLRELYLTGFEIAVKEGKPKSIMTSYNQINGVYANENSHLLLDILREEWGFDGAVITDWGGSNDHTEGVRCGSTLEMPGTLGDSDRQLIQAVKDGKIPERDVDQRAKELLRLVLSVADAKEKSGAPFDTDAHHALARKAAEECIVLLKNEDGLLPVASGKQTALIGDFVWNPRYQGAGSSSVNAIRVDTVKELAEEGGLTVCGYGRGYLRNGKRDEGLLKEAAELAGKADIAIVFAGLTETAETEGLDRSHMRLPENQTELITEILRANRNTVVVLSGGSAVELPWIGQCRALVHSLLSGQAGAGAVIDVLTGRVNPSGKLAETYPLAYEDTPAFRYWPSPERTSEYRESLYVGYRYYDTVKKPVLFPFGYGLSYTEFAYDGLEISESAVSFCLTNTGKREGAEIAQVYVGKKDGDVFRPEKELKGFCRVLLKPGETKRVTVALDDKAFRYYDTEAGRWQREGGAYEIFVGASVADIRLSGQISIEGTGHPSRKKEVLSHYYGGDITRVPEEEFAALLGRPVPDGSWDKEKPLGMNDAVCQMYYAKSRLARLVWRILTRLKERGERKEVPDLNILFIYNIPFRGIAKMMNGLVSMKMAEDVLMMVNGSVLKGLRRLAGDFRENRKNGGSL